MSAPSPVKPRGTRIAGSLRAGNGANGVYSVYPGGEPKSIGNIEPLKWDKDPAGPVVQAMFTIIGEMGMTGQVILLDQAKWDALQKTKLVNHFYAALLWGGTPLKVVDDALLIAKRAGG
jgi:hypothetical protein